MQIVDGPKSILIADTSLINDGDKFHFHIQQHIWACGINKIDTVPFNGDTQLKLGNLKINIGGSILPNYTNILTSNTIIEKPLLIENNTLIILSSKLKSNQNQAIAKQLESNYSIVKNVLENGAITINIEP
jgi:hypothetical protein